MCSVAAHATTFGVAWTLAPDRRPHVGVRDGPAGGATVRIESVEVEAGAERPGTSEAGRGSVRAAFEALAPARKMVRDALRGGERALDALSDGVRDADEARARGASALLALLEDGLELGGACERELEQIEARAARIGAAARMAEEQDGAAGATEAATGPEATSAPEATDASGSDGAPAGSAGAATPARADVGNRAPEYPLEARRRGQEGVVALRLEIDERGRVERAEIAGSSGWPLLDDAAVRAARAWRFDPALLGGAPVASRASVPVRFRLTDGR